MFNFFYIVAYYVLENLLAEQIWTERHCKVKISQQYSNMIIHSEACFWPPDESSLPFSSNLGLHHLDYLQQLVLNMFAACCAQNQYFSPIYTNLNVHISGFLCLSWFVQAAVNQTSGFKLFGKSFSFGFWWSGLSSERNRTAKQNFVTADLCLCRN